jgi:hypothetical protein
MNNKELEILIKSESEKITPNLWLDIKDGAQSKKGRVITVTPQKRKSRLLSYISTVLAALVLISAAVFGITNYNRADSKQVASVYIEVEPQIELSLNTYNVVLDAIPKNEEGKKVIEGVSLKDAQYEYALNEIVASMVKKGYLTSDENSVLISIETQDKVKSNSLYTLTTNDIKAYGFALNVNIQKIENAEQLKTDAQNLNISLGKALLINNIISRDKKYSKPELSVLSVHQLNLIYQSYNNNKESAN